MKTLLKLVPALNIDGPQKAFEIWDHVELHAVLQFATGIQKKWLLQLCEYKGKIEKNGIEKEKESMGKGTCSSKGRKKNNQVIKKQIRNERRKGREDAEREERKEGRKEEWREGGNKEGRKEGREGGRRKIGEKAEKIK